jgi:hypothetical protein
MILTVDDLKAKGWELRECPFCGGSEDLQLVDDRCRRPQVQCRCCGVTLQRSTAWMAVVGWNTRKGESDGVS